MNRKLLAGVLAVSLALVTCIANVASAATNNPEAKLKQIQQDKKKTKEELSQAQSQLNEQKKKLQDIESKMNELDQQIAEHSKKLQESQDLIDKQSERFKETVVLMYVNGSSHYFSQLLQAQSFGDFLRRLETIHLLLSSQHSIIDNYLKAKENIQKELDAINQKKQELVPLMNEEQKSLAAIQKDVNSKNAKLQELQQAEDMTQAELDKIKAEVRAANAGVSYGSGKFLWPVPGGIFTSPFGMRNGRMHEGIDIAKYLGAPILAADSGVVVLMKSNPGGYGYYIVIDHGNGYKTLYGHMYRSTVTVNVGDHVEKGQKIAEVGNNGHSTGPHLHFEVHVNGEPVDPCQFFKSQCRR